MFGKSKAAPAAPETSITPSASGDFAGFWLRFLAAFADSAMLFSLSFVIFIVASFAGDMGAMIAAALVALLQICYWPVMHASERQATFGKAMVGIKVTHVDGERISMLRSFGRWLATIISVLPLGIGFLMAGFTARKQALHDMIASTLVVRDGDAHIARAIVVTVLGYAVPMIAIPLFGMAMFAGLAASFMGDMASEMKNQPGMSAPPAAPKPAAPAAPPAPASTAAPAPGHTTAAPVAPGGASKTGDAATPAATATPAPASTAEASKAGAAAPAKAGAAPAVSAAPAPAAPPKLEVPADAPEVKAPTRRRAPRPASAAAENAAPKAADPAPATTFRHAPDPNLCVYKPVMTDEEIKACRRR